MRFKVGSPLISIITISYNQAGYIRETIESVIKQKNELVEYIIIDGGSSDGSVELIQEYGEHLSAFVSEKDKGPANALNKGLRLAKGEYFYYLNSDDVLLDDAVAKLIALAQRDENIDLYYGHGLMYFDHDGSKIGIYSDKWDLQRYQSGVVTIIQQATLLKTSFLESIGGFNEENRINWDGELLVDAAINGARFERFNEKIALFRMYSQSISGGLAQNSQRVKENVNRINQKILDVTGTEKQSKLLAYAAKFIVDPVVCFKKIFTNSFIRYKLKRME